MPRVFCCRLIRVLTLHPSTSRQLKQATEAPPPSPIPFLWSMRNRRLQRDVVYLGWPIVPSYMSPSAGLRGSCGGLSQWVQLCTWSPNKLWRSNSIFNLWCENIVFAKSINVAWCRVSHRVLHTPKRPQGFLLSSYQGPYPPPAPSDDRGTTPPPIPFLWSMRNRRLHRDVIYLGWPIAPRIWAQLGGGGGCGGLSQWVYSCAHEAQINFGDLTPYLTYDAKWKQTVVFAKSINEAQCHVSHPCPLHRPKRPQGFLLSSYQGPYSPPAPSDDRGTPPPPPIPFLWSMRNRRLQRDVVYLCWPIAPSYMSPNAGSQPISTAVHRSPNKLWWSNSIFDQAKNQSMRRECRVSHPCPPHTHLGGRSMRRGCVRGAWPRSRWGAAWWCSTAAASRSAWFRTGTRYAA